MQKKSLLLLLLIPALLSAADQKKISVLAKDYRMSNHQIEELFHRRATYAQESHRWCLKNFKTTLVEHADDERMVLRAYYACLQSNQDVRKTQRDLLVFRAHKPKKLTKMPSCKK